MTDAPRWASAGVTDVGLHRAHNEDALLDRSDLGLWVVADGMGGHERGEVASAMLCEGLASVPADADLAEAVDAIDDLVEDINARLLDMGAALPGGGIVGSTLVMLVARGEFAVFMWAGDSRVYLLRENRLSLLSEDHSLHTQQHARGEPTDPSTSNVITRAVGASSALHLDLDLLRLQERDRFLLCSDGLCNEVNDGRLMELLLHGSAAEAAHRLVESARESGGHDNITALVADYRAAVPV
jgi:protein phosphatase